MIANSVKPNSKNRNGSPFRFLKKTSRPRKTIREDPVWTLADTLPIEIVEDIALRSHRATIAPVLEELRRVTKDVRDSLDVETTVDFAQVGFEDFVRGLTVRLRIVADGGIWSVSAYSIPSSFAGQILLADRASATRHVV